MPRADAKNGTPRRDIAIVGGGIAGMGCAWALHRAGMRVTVYEREPQIGGNAKTHAWAVGDREIVTGLSVLAWPDALFHNYIALLRELEIATETAPPLRFFINDGGAVVAHGLETDGSRRYAEDMRRWARLVAFVRRVNNAFAKTEVRSLYEYSPLNPLIVLPLRRLTRVFGISVDFWERVFVPIHSSSFLSVDLDGLPASIAPSIEDIVSIAHGARLSTWSGTSRDVFDRLARGFEDRVIRGCHVTRIERGDAGVSIDETTSGRSHFDAVVFACNPHAALAMLAPPTRTERWLLGGIAYPDASDPTFLRGDVHSDPALLPEAHRERLLTDYANYIEIAERDGRLHYENTFILSSWVPAARGAGLPMLVSYHRQRAVERSLRTVTNEKAHPCLTTNNLARAWLLRCLQGRRSTYFCGSYATPGNGHDLSLLSGLVVANALGVAYPFADDAAPRADFQRLASFMLG